MTTAIIGVPGGMELRHDQLRDLVSTRMLLPALLRFPFLPKNQPGSCHSMSHVYLNV
jgi:hypothetical protein